MECYRITDFLECQPGIVVLFHVNGTAMDETQLLKEMLHDRIIAVGVNSQMATLLKCPADAVCIMPFMAAAVSPKDRIGRNTGDQEF